MPPPKDPPPPAVNESGEVPWDVHVQRINHQLVHTYRTVLLPIEDALKYDTFRPSWFAETIAQTKPFVTFLGPFSAGKSSFINYLLQGNFLQSGPQPTTDKFTAVMHGSQTTMNIPGRVLAAAADQPFRGLNQFGESFLDCFSGVQIDHPLLKSVTLIDTPGVLETGETHMRRYDYVKVCRWFVERSDLIFMMFDPTKLDAGTELRGLFQQAIKGNESKVRIVLNKADMVGSQDLMRVYGALFWNLSNLINTTEPPRVYVSSFWDKPYQARTNHKLFTIEKTDLLFELTETVPLGALDRRVANLIRRAQDVLIHAYVVGTIKQGMPKVFGKAKAKQDALNNLEFTYETLADRYKVALADLPDADEYRTFFATVEINDMRRIETMEKMGWIETLRTLINVKLPKLLTPIQSHASIDPRDRKHAIEMQRLYFAKMSESAAPPSAPEAHSVATNVLSSAAAVQCSPVPPAGIQPSSTPAVDAATIAALQIQNQQMMALLMQHMQNSNPAGNSASPSPSSPQQ